MKSKYLTIGLLVGFAVGFIIGFAPAHKKYMDTKEEVARQKEELIKQTGRAEKAEATYGDMVLDLQARQREELAKLYNNIYDYKKGENKVGLKYISSFWVDEKEITVKLTNTGVSSVKPNAEIIFLNKQGFVTATHNIFWLLSKIKRNEIRIEKSRISFNFGEPVYYTVKFGS